MKEERQITKELILQELDRLPEEILVKVLESLRSFNSVSEDRSDSRLPLFSEENSKTFHSFIVGDGDIVRESSILDSTRSSPENSDVDRRTRVRQAYLASKQEREEVYRRLANS